MRQLQVLTNSELTTFLNCRALHGYEYHELLRPLVQSRPLRRGGLYHLGLRAGWIEAWSQANWHLPLVERVELARIAAAGAIAEARIAEVERINQSGESVQLDELEEIVSIATWGAKHYFQVRQEYLDPAKYIPVAVEQPFSVRVHNAKGNPTQLVWEGVIDLVLYDIEQNMLRIEDHKMSDSPAQYEKKLCLDTQTTGYVYAASEIQKAPLAFFPFVTASGAGYALEGVWSLIERANVGSVAFDVMKGKVPATPKINQNGEVSVAACDTLPEIYGDALVDQACRGLEITPKQREFCEKLKLKGPWMRQYEFYRTADDIERWKRELEIAARSIRETGRNPALRIRNPGHCTGAMSYSCPMDAVCSDPESEATRRNNYRVATTSHEEVAEARANGSEKEFGF